jgi:hypothetical protein
MTEQLRQSLSAVIDDEADAFELRRVLDELERDPSLRETWERYHLIGNVLRGERTRYSQSAARVLAIRVPEALRETTSADATTTAATDATPGGAVTVVPPERSRGSRSLRGAGLAVLAACLVIALGIAFVPGGAENAPVEVSVAGRLTDLPVVPSGPLVAAVTDEQGAVLVGAEGFGGASPSDLRRAHAYMLQHAQRQGLEQRGVISLVKMATYEAP